MIFNFQFKRECRHSEERKGSSRIKKNLNQKHSANKNNNLPGGAHLGGNASHDGLPTACLYPARSDPGRRADLPVGHVGQSELARGERPEPKEQDDLSLVCADLPHRECCLEK